MQGAVTDYITIRSRGARCAAAGPGIRMTPAFAAQLPMIKSPNSLSALQTAAAANHWKLMFLEFQANVDGYGDIIALGAGDSSQTAAVAGAVRASSSIASTCTAIRDRARSAASR